MRRTIDYIGGKVLILDQTLLPDEIVYIHISSSEEMADAILRMNIRGAPAIGAAAALGIALAAECAECGCVDELLTSIQKAAKNIRATRPTAVNLFRETERMVSAAYQSAKEGNSALHISADLRALALDILREDDEINRRLGDHGATLLPHKANVLTHCNAGALACVSYGTALGIVRSAVAAGKNIHVYADETRPRLQGMKLTCFELNEDGIPVTVITDSTAGYLMSSGDIDCVIVGTDRVAANGDIANKIGTYSVAVLADYHGIPFYVAAPISSIDLSTRTGADIPIEERSSDEVTHINGQRIAPAGVRAINPAFDVTPSKLITAIITEVGILRMPFEQTLRQAAESLKG